MRKLIPALALVALGSAAAAAQSPVSMKPSIFAGVALPTGDNSNGLNTGFTAGAAVDLGAPLVPVGLRAEGSYSYFGLKDDLQGDTGNSSDVSGRINAVLSIPSIVLTPYLIGGIGIYHLMTSQNSAINGNFSDSSNNFGWNIGAGIDLPLVGFAARLEARYHSVSTDFGNYTYVPITLGIRF
jgi:opacity protein-like surface antigen